MELDAVIKKAQQGDDKAFNDVLNLSYERMFRCALKYCGHQSNAEDITQQACVKLARTIHQYRFEAKFSTWLYRLVINCAKDWQRSQLRHQGLEADKSDTGIESGSVGSKGENLYYLQQVLAQIETMGKGFRMTVMLVLGEGLTHAQAAELLEIKESTVAWRIHEVRKRLRPLNTADAM